jgi:hypothetical protein
VFYKNGRTSALILGFLVIRPCDHDGSVTQ